MFRKRKHMVSGVTAAISTCGRPRKLRRCVESILADGVIDYVIIWNSAPEPCAEVSSLADEFSIVTVFEAGRLTGPSEARFELAKRCKTEFLLYSDDNKDSDPGATAELVRLIRSHGDVDILTAARRSSNNGKWFDLSQRIHFGKVGGRTTVHKTFIWPEDCKKLGLDMIASDIPSGQLLVRTSLLDRVNFDPQYDFFFELYDFGMSCLREGIRIFATPLAVFEHDFGGYTHLTMRDRDREIDRRKFMAKWNVTQIGPTGGGLK